MGSDDKLRPFVCDGDPLQTEVFIVGINPATKMDTSFWKYYDGSLFDKKKWMKAYLTSRADKRTKLSPTRKKIEDLVNDVFAEYLCLETNVYSSPTISLKELSLPLRNTDIFNFLVRTIKPKALLIHGSDPAEFIRQEFNVRFKSVKPIVINFETSNTVSPYVFEWEFGTMAICAMKHLRLMKMEEIKKTSKALIEMLKQL